MATCDYCGKKISPRATTCPNCGDDRKTESFTDAFDGNPLAFLYFVVCAAVGIGVASALWPSYWAIPIGFVVTFGVGFVVEKIFGLK